MSIKRSQVALHVRVKFNELFEPKSLGENYLIKDEIIFIADKNVYNDIVGDYVFLKGFTPPKTENDPIFVNGGYAYLNQLDLEFPINY